MFRSSFSSPADGSSGSVADVMLIHLEAVGQLKIDGCFADELGLSHMLVVCGFDFDSRLLILDRGGGANAKLHW